MKTPPPDLIFKLYAAVGKPEAWNGVVADLCGFFNASVGMWVALGQGQQEHSFYASHNHPESLSRAYSEHWWQHDVWTLAALRQGALRTGVVGIGSEYVSLAELRASAFYREFLSTMPAEQVLGLMIADGSDSTPVALATAPPTYISLFRPPGAALFTPEDKANLAALHPHLRRAFDLQCQWRVMQEQLNVFNVSIGLLDFGVVFIDAMRRVRYANSTAEALARKLWPSIHPADASQSILAQVLQDDDTSALTRLVNAAALGTGDFVRLCNTVAKPLQAVALAMPVSSPASNAAGKVRSSVLLTLVDSASRPFAAANFLSRAFDLNKSESRMLPLLLKGSTPAEIAQALKIKLPTVRSQLAAVFVKTGTARQQDLIALMGTVPPVCDSTPGPLIHG